MTNQTGRAWGQTLGVLLVAFSAAGFSAKAILVKLAYQAGGTPLSVLAWRMLFALPFFIGSFWWGTRRGYGGPIGRGEYARIVALGLVGYHLASLFDFWGLQFISASLERMILFTYPMLVLLINALIYRRPVRRREWLAMAVTYSGVLLLFGGGPAIQGKNAWYGVGLVAVSAVAYAAYLAGSENRIRRFGVLRYTSAAMIVSCLAVLAQSALTPELAIAETLSGELLGLCLAMAILSTVFPVFALAAGMARIGSGRAGIVSAAGPVLTILLAIGVLDEPFGPLDAVGAALVLTGVVLAGRGRVNPPDAALSVDGR